MLNNCVTIHTDYVTKSLYDASYLSNFIREVAALTLLNNAKIPNIVQLLEVLPGAKLKLNKFDGDLIDYSPDNDELHYLVYRILIIMHNISQLGIVHRDIKPENILTSKDNKHIALCDFGLSRFFSDNSLEQSTSSVQTRQYRSPELLFKGYTFNPKTLDIWSLGISILALLIDKIDICPPSSPRSLSKLHKFYVTMYGKDTFNDAIMDHAEHVGIDRRFMIIIKSMLTMDPMKRPDPLSLLSDTFFDKFRHISHDKIINVQKFQEDRIILCIDLLDNAQKLSLLNHDIDYIKYYNYDNKSTFYLALLLYVKLIVIGLPGGGQINDTTLLTLIGIATSVYDSTIMDMNIKNTMDILNIIGYDLFLPVHDVRVKAGLDKLFKIV
jgi:serine/threonine protein kinase